MLQTLFPVTSVKPLFGDWLTSAGPVQPVTRRSHSSVSFLLKPSRDTFVRFGSVAKNDPRDSILKPLAILLGDNALSQLPASLKAHGFKRPLVIYGDTALRNGMVGSLRNSLAAEGLVPTMVQWQSQSSVNGLIDGIARKISPFANPDVVIALGGGTLIDNAAFYASSNHMAYITVLTSQATDVGLSPIASLYSPSDVKTSYVTGLPHTAVVDYVLLDSNAPLMNYAGIGDIVAKLTAVNDWNRSHAQPNQIEGNEFDPISALIATTLLQGLIHWARPSIDNREFLHQLYKTQLIAGYLMELAGCRRVAGGSEHQLAAEMEKMGETAPHGIVVGLCTYVVSKVQDDPAVHEAIKKFLQKTGFFEYLAQHGPHVSEQLLLQAINRCADPELKPGYHTVLLEPGKAQAAIQFVKSDPTIRPVLLKVQEVC